MSQNEEVRIELTVKDKASREIKRGYDAISREAKKAERATDAISKKQGNMRQLATHTQQVAKGGDAIARAMQQAANQMSRAVRESARLQQNMHKAHQAARKTSAEMSKMQRFGGTAMSVGGGALAAGSATAYALAKPIAYETQLARMSNVAFSDRDAKGRIAGMEKLDSLIKSSVQSGGGSKDDAAAALNSMLAAGTKMADVEKILPTIQKAAVASGASGEELAAIITKGISQGVFKAEDAATVLDKALKAGELGEFELKDMAKWLPSLLASSSGMKDMAGFESTLANLQGVNRVAGSTDEGANAYKNFLLKLTSTDTAGKFSKDFGIDITKEMMKAREAGQDPVQAMVKIMQDKIIGSNKSYQALQKKLENTKDDAEREKVLKQMQEILQASAIGKIFSDREAMLGFLGVSTQQKYIEETRQALQNAQGSVNTSWQVMQSTTAAKAQETMTGIENGIQGIFTTFKSSIDSGLDMVNNAMRGNEAAQMTAGGGVIAAGALAAGGTVAAGVNFMRGKGGDAIAKGAAPATTPKARDAISMMTGGGNRDAIAKGANNAAKSGGMMTQGMKGFAKVAAPLAAVHSGMSMWGTLTDDTLSFADKGDALLEQVMGLAGGFAGGAAGTALAPGVGTAAGAVGGSLAGAEFGDRLGDVIFKDAEISTLLPDFLRNWSSDDNPLTADVNVVVQLDGSVIYESVEKQQTQQAKRH